MSVKSRNKLSGGIGNSYQRTLFDYISFCKHLNLNEIQRIIITNYGESESKISIIKDEIFNLFINENTKFTHLYIPEILIIKYTLFLKLNAAFQKLNFLVVVLE